MGLSTVCAKALFGADKLASIAAIMSFMCSSISPDRPKYDFDAFSRDSYMDVLLWGCSRAVSSMSMTPCAPGAEDPGCNAYRVLAGYIATRRAPTVSGVPDGPAGIGLSAAM